MLNPFNLPPGEPGTEPVTNLPGNAFTEAGNEAVTLRLLGYSSVISLAPFNGKAGAVTGTAKGAPVATASVTGKGTSTSAPQSSVEDTKSGCSKVTAQSFISVSVSLVLLFWTS